MSDAFALLGLPRQASLEPEAVKTAYIERCRDAHPDRAEGDARLSAELNAAYELLREPEGRLKHLLDLEGGAEATAWATVPMDETLMQLFSRLGSLLTRLDGWVKRHETAASALARALLASEQMTLQEEVENVLADLEQQRAELTSRLPETDQLRKVNPPAATAQMRTLRAHFAYLSKWTTQAREALLKLV